MRGFLESCTSDGAGPVVLQDGVGAVHVQCDLSLETIRECSSTRGSHRAHPSHWPGSTPTARASDGEEGRDNTGTHRVASRLSRLTSSRCQGRAEKPVKKQAPEARRERKQKFTSETWKRQQPKVGGFSHVFLRRIESTRFLRHLSHLLTPPMMTFAFSKRH